MRRTVVTALLAFLFATSLTTVAQATESIRGPGYRTAAPSGWHIDRRSSNGWRTATITPPGHVNNQRDVALVSIAVASTKTVKKNVRSSIYNQERLVQELISVPRGADQVGVLYAPRPTVLRGKRGVIFAIHYSQKGHGTTQSATLIRRGNRMYLIQVILDQDLSELGNSAAGMVQGRWRWR